MSVHACTDVEIPSRHAVYDVTCTVCVCDHVSARCGRRARPQDKMLARQAKQDAAIAATHKALATRLSTVRAASEAEAQRQQGSIAQLVLMP